VVSVKALLLASPKNKISDIMERDVIFASTGDDVESLANEFRKYDLLAMPIVDNEQRLVGIVTVDDMLDVQVEEATDDFEIMAAMSPSDEPYLKTSVWVLVKNRLPWLVILMLTATITGLILESFENAMAVIPILITFIPMLMDTGGSGGAQSSTLIIRGLALEEIRLRDILKVLWRELRVALLCGFALAIVNFIRIFIMYARHEVVGSFVGELGITVSFALWITVVVAKIVGCMLPLGAKLLKLDPAVMAAPVITTIVDACGLLVFFGIAKAIFAL
jgi:magnesium transporter